MPVLPSSPRRAAGQRCDRARAGAGRGGANLSAILSATSLRPAERPPHPTLSPHAGRGSHLLQTVLSSAFADDEAIDPACAVRLLAGVAWPVAGGGRCDRRFLWRPHGDG